MVLFSHLQAWLATREHGQGLVEYALILVLVSIVVVAALLLIGGKINNVFGSISDNL